MFSTCFSSKSVNFWDFKILESNRQANERRTTHDWVLAHIYSFCCGLTSQSAVFQQMMPGYSRDSKIWPAAGHNRHGVTRVLMPSLSSCNLLSIRGAPGNVSLTSRFEQATYWSQAKHSTIKIYIMVDLGRVVLKWNMNGVLHNHLQFIFKIGEQHICKLMMYWKPSIMTTLSKVRVQVLNRW